MKRISFLILCAVLVATPVFGQDTATQQQIDKLTGQIQDLLAAQGRQDQTIADLRRDISELRDKVNTPQVNDNASRDDLKKLAEQVQEVDKKRLADRELILKEIDRLGKAVVVAAAVPTHISKTSTPKPAADDNDTAAPATPQNGYEYVVQKGDSLSAIAKAYRAKGVKVTTTQIIKANPGLSAATLYSGRKIFIPDANAK
jgi:LysM repeat protein